MFQTAIDIEQYAALDPDMIRLGRVDAGSIMTTTGTHPQLGAFALIEDIDPGFILLSERPIPSALALTQGSPLTGFADASATHVAERPHACG